MKYQCKSQQIYKGLSWFECNEMNDIYRLDTMRDLSVMKWMTYKGGTLSVIWV